MSAKRIILAVTAALVAATTLTACDPPYPPELLEAFYDQNPVCETGNVPVSVDQNLSTLVPSWQDTMTGSCPDMSISIASSASNVNISSDLNSIKSPNVYAYAPYFVDAGVATVTFASGTVINFSLKSLFDILSGKITTWNAPELAKENPQLKIPSSPITVNPEADSEALAALENWAKLEGVAVPSTLLTTPKPNLNFDLTTSGEGEISIVRLSTAEAASVAPSAIVVNDKYLKGTVLASDSSAYSGASQFVSKSKAGKVSLKLDRTLSPEPPKGADKADLPYSAVFFGWISLSGKDNTLDRSVARFLLRSDEQGILSQGSIGILPTAIRISSLDAVSVGLKLPKMKVKKP